MLASRFDAQIPGIRRIRPRRTVGMDFLAQLFPPCRGIGIGSEMPCLPAASLQGIGPGFIPQVGGVVA